MKTTLKILTITLNLLLANFLFASNNTINQIATQYVKLALSLGEHDKFYIDAYYGPTHWRIQAKSTQLPLSKIITAANALQAQLTREKSNDPMVKLRLLYLKTQLGALAAKAMMLSGDAEYSFDQEAKALYDTVPPSTSLSRYQPILAELERVIPGKGKLSQRIEAFQRQYIIPKNRLKIVFDAAIKACRKRTKPYVNLLPHENFKLEFVTGKPWGGYNWYQGGSFSIIQVNTDLPIYIDRALDLGCHEGYPGHHTYNGLLEANLVKKRGWVEYSVYPLYSPQSLIAEGSANLGVEMAFPGEEKLKFEKEVLYPLAGIEKELAVKYDKVLQLISQLAFAGNEVARLYINKKISAKKATKMLQQYTLLSKDKAKKRVSFINTYGAYVINYNWGKILVKNWIAAGPDQSPMGRWKRFTQLLSSPRLPSSLQ